MDLYYGSNQIPHPLPFIAISDSAINNNGYDGALESISLVGQLTGCSFEELCAAKDNLISVFAEDFVDMTYSGSSQDNFAGFSGNLNFLKVVSINFPDISKTKILPYEVELERYDSSNYHKNYGITDPKNSWTYEEQDDRTLMITHEMGAKGAHCEGLNADPLQNAINYVNSGISGLTDSFNYFDSFKTNGILISENENIDRIGNSYSVTRKYKKGFSADESFSGYVCRYTTNVATNPADFNNVKIDGIIEGGFYNNINTGMFVSGMAYSGALKAYYNSMSSGESGISYALNPSPMSASYEVDDLQNTLGFSFEFTDDPRNLPFVLDYNISISESQESCFSTVSIEGSVKYMGIGISIDNDSRFDQLNDFFDTVDLHALANEFYLDNDGEYYLNPKKISESVTKDKFASLISFNCSFTDKKSYPEPFIEFDYSTSTDRIINRYASEQSLCGVCFYDLGSSSIGRKTLDGNGVFEYGGLNQASNYISDLIRTETPVYDNVFEEDSSSTISVDGDSISFSKSWIYYDN